MTNCPHHTDTQSRSKAPEGKKKKKKRSSLQAFVFWPCFWHGHGHQWINPSVFVDPLTFAVEPPSGLDLSCEMSPLLDEQAQEYALTL